MIQESLGIVRSTSIGTFNEFADPRRALRTEVLYASRLRGSRDLIGTEHGWSGKPDYPTVREVCTNVDALDHSSLVSATRSHMAEPGLQQIPGGGARA